MPDNMSPENPQLPISSSVKVVTDLGAEEARNFPRPTAVIEFPGAVEQRKAAEGFPRLEYKSNPPDIRMQQPNPFNDKPNQESGDENNPNAEAEAQKYTRRESLSDELISGAESPQELFIGLRLMEKQREESFIPPNLDERYTPPRQLSAMYERAEMLRYSIKEMEDRGWITNYNPTTGEAKIKDRRFGALAVKTEINEKPNGGFMQQEVKYYFGRTEAGSTGSKEREVLEKAYRRGMVELAARDIMGEHFGVRDNTEIRDSLESLTAIMHGGRMPKFKAEHLVAIFNMPGVAELGRNPENRVLGDQVEEAMFLNLVMLSSGNKQRMLDLLDRPGAKHLIAKMAKEANLTYDQWTLDNIGKVNGWVDDKNRDLTTTWREEAADGRRGSLTKWANISAWGGDPGEFGKDKEDQFIEKTIGGLCGSVEASWVAGVMMRVLGAYASEGYVALPDGTSLLPLGEGRFISGDDTGKFWAYMFNLKEGKKGRTSGLKDMIGRIPDLAMNLFDWAQVEVEEPNKVGTLEKVRRSVWDAWLGTAGNKPVKDLLTGKDTGDKTVEEPYHRLGDLNFKSLEREFHNTFTIMQWLMGNAERPTGVFIEAMNVDDFKFEDFSLNKLKKMWKYIDIVMNPIVLTKGSRHLYELGTIVKDEIRTVDLTPEGVGRIQMHEINTKNTETIKRRYFRNLMAARIRSFTFLVGILPKAIGIANPGMLGGATTEVPAANLVELFINEATKENPKDEDELVWHYLDDVARLGSVDKDAKKSVEIRERAKSWLKSSVGRVTGKKS